MVPPFLSEALYTLVRAALNSGLLPELVSEPESLVPPHAAVSASDSTAVLVTSTLDLRFTCSNLPGGTARVRATSAPALRIEGVTQPIAEQVESQHCDEDGHAREEHEVPDRVEPGRFREHAAPAGRRRADAHAEERQRRLEQDVRRDQQGGVDQDRRDQVRQDLLEDDVRPPRADAAGGVDEVALAQRQALTADDPADVRPAEEA